MNAVTNRLSTDDSTLPPSAVALAVGAVRLHAGIAFKLSDGEVQVLHLAMHYKLRTSEWGGWCYAMPHPTLDILDLILVASFCGMIKTRRPRIPYGLRFKRSSFDDDGKFTPGSDESGLTCASFVIAVFDWATIPLVLGDAWQARADDAAAQAKLVTVLREYGDAAPEHIEAVEREVGCIRIRPEEVAGATTTESRPVNFVDAERIGREVLAEFDALGL
jgi:hypothetical protein